MATAKRTGGKAAKVTTNPTPRQVRAATGPRTSDTTRDQAYRQGGAAAKRAMDERRRGRPTRGPAQVHNDPELQEYYEQGHADTVRDARRNAVSSSVKPATTKITSVGTDGAGFVLGLIGYALLRNYLTGGWSGVSAWLSAKFVNNVPSSSTAPSTTRPGYPANPGGSQTIAGGPFGPPLGSQTMGGGGVKNPGGSQTMGGAPIANPGGSQHF